MNATLTFSDVRGEVQLSADFGPGGFDEASPAHKIASIAIAHLDKHLEKSTPLDLVVADSIPVV